jgi:hypothetical protein
MRVLERKSDIIVIILHLVVITKSFPKLTIIQYRSENIAISIVLPDPFSQLVPPNLP